MKWRERRSCRTIPILSICLLSCSACLLYFFRLMFLVEDTSFHMMPDVSVQDFLVNTSGCQIPAWDPWDESVKLFYKPTSRYKCSGKPSFLRVLPNAVISLDETFLRYYYEIDPQNVSCIYNEIQRNTSITDENTDNRIILHKPLNLTFDKPLGIDFVKTMCHFVNHADENVQMFHEFLPLTPLKTEVEYRSTRLQDKISPMNRPMNIIFIGLDSISHLNFLRHFPNCKKFLPNGASLFNMEGYTKVGDNTFPNIMPLLTGHFYQHFYNEASNKSMFFDDVAFIWKVFSELGYRTLLAEDAPDIATFNYYRNGFKNPPTDYYYRPFALAVESSEIKKKSKSHCFGNKMEMEVIYDYLKSFVDTLGNDRPFFAFIFLARLTHDILNYAGYADEPTYRLLMHLENSKVLENSLLIFFSDHGIRYGPIRKTYIGQFEERMPFMNLYVPKWFLNKYKVFEQNLNANKKQLTTPFDIHATLLHLASITSGNDDLADIPKRGVSLFKEVPPNRTCTTASISPHWCPCQKFKLISIADYLVQKAAKVIIDFVNNRISAYRKKCATLTLDSILSARLVRKDNSSISDNFLIAVSASPSYAIFEATVHCDSTKENTCHVLDDISRINEYGKQSICINDAELRKFCYCLS